MRDVFERLKAAAAGFAPANCVIVVLERDEAHVQVEVPDTEDAAVLYEAGQKAMYSLSLFLEQMKPAVAAQAQRKAQSS